MSAGFGASAAGCEGCGCTGHRLGDWNLTYNLSPMLRAAGFPGWQETVGRLAEVQPVTAKRVLPVFDAVLAELRADPDRYRAMNPENGWGSYDQAVRTLDDFVEAIRPHPDALIDSWL